MKLRQTSNIKGRILIATAVFILAVLFWRFFPTPGEFISETIFRPLLQGETALNNLVRGESQPLSDEDSNELDYLRAENRRRSHWTTKCTTVRCFNDRQR